MAPSDPVNKPIDARIQRLEESLAFAQHEGGQLAAEVLALGMRISPLLRRIESLERQMQAGRARDGAHGKPNEDSGQARANGESLGDNAER